MQEAAPFLLGHTRFAGNKKAAARARVKRRPYSVALFLRLSAPCLVLSQAFSVPCLVECQAFASPRSLCCRRCRSCLRRRAWLSASALHPCPETGAAFLWRYPPFVRFGNDLVAGVSGGVGRGLSGEHREASSSADKAMIDFFISPSFLRYVPFVMKQDGMKRPLNDLRIGLKPKIDIKFY